MIQKDNLFGIVVWYNPSKDNISATDSYVNGVRKLIIIDNSDTDNSLLIKEKKWDNTLYFPNFENKGIATALNLGCEVALSNGAEWVLTMDQDSYFDKNGLANLIKKANQYTRRSETAIFAPVHSVEHMNNKIKSKDSVYHIAKDVMTSGNLLSMSAYRQTGRFLDELFIDLVDHEYCIRLIEQGYLVVTVTDVLLHHFLGNGTYPVRFWGLKKIFHDHSPIRKYYIARNSLYLSSLHPDQRSRFRRYLLKEIKRVLLYDRKQKWIKLRYMLKGIIDYKKGIKGPFAWHE